MKHVSFPALLRTAFIAGTLDILCAILSTFLMSGRGPVIIFKYIASGLLGADAMSGGTAVAALGLFLHYVIAFGWTFLFFALYNAIKRLGLHWAVVGVLYGLFVWTLMNLVVVPLSQIGPRPLTLSSVLLQAGILVVAIGLPISYGAHRGENR